MFLAIDLGDMTFIGAAEHREWLDGWIRVDQPCEASLIVDTADGKTWSTLSDAEMKMLYRGICEADQAPDYGTCLKELREMGAAWENSHEVSFFEEKAKLAAKMDKQFKALEVENRQKQIKHAESNRPSGPLPGESEGDSKPRAPKEPSGAPRKPGATKMVWDICDREYNGQALDKVFREHCKTACLAEGINEGTFGVQFGKWKHSKGA